MRNMECSKSHNVGGPRVPAPYASDRQLAWKIGIAHAWTSGPAFQPVEHRLKHVAHYSHTPTKLSAFRWMRNNLEYSMSLPMFLAGSAT